MHFILQSFILAEIEALETQQKEKEKLKDTLLWKSTITFNDVFLFLKPVF